MRRFIIISVLALLFLALLNLVQCAAALTTDTKPRWTVPYC